MSRAARAAAGSVGSAKEVEIEERRPLAGYWKVRRLGKRSGLEVVSAEVTETI